jgi:hypothetical protein
VVKETRLTPDFDYQAYRQQHDQALPLFVISESRRLQDCTAAQPIAPKPGQTIIGLVRP